MKKKIAIDGFIIGNTPDREETNERKLRKPPQLETRIHHRKWGEDGVGLEIMNYWVLKIELNGVIVEEHDFEKLFPSFINNST